MEVEGRERQLANLKPFQPGVSGNPNGRPAGGRTVFSQGFLKDLASVWPEEGRETMVKTARPAVFFATCARLIPNDVRVTVQQQLPGNLSAEDWAMMREIVEAVKQAIVAAASVDFQTSTGTTVIDLYTWTTPNGRKACIALEELGYPTRCFRSNRQVRAVQAENRPQHRNPAIVDRDNGMSLMESGAILIYLAAKTAKLLPKSGEGVIACSNG